MKFDVLCFGSATCDIYLKSFDFKIKNEEGKQYLLQEYGAKLNAEECIITTGGGATNAAVCFERMGLQAAIIACTGKDYWGRVVRAKLSEEGVSLIHAQKTDKDSTSVSVALVGEDGGRTVIVHRAASNLLSEKQVDWKRLDASFVYASSLGGDFKLLDKIVGLCRKKEIKLAFNPGSREIGERKQLKSFLPYINVLILNKSEILTLLNKDSYEKRGVFGLGAEMVLVTDGSRGARLYYEKDKIINWKVEKSEAIETTGAGDSFGSGFVVGILKKLSLEDSLKLATFNAKSVIGEIGPKKGLLFWPEVKRLLK